MQGAVEQDRVEGVFGGAGGGGRGEGDRTGRLTAAGEERAHAAEFLTVAQAEVAHVAVELADAFLFEIGAGGGPGGVGE